MIHATGILAWLVLAAGAPTGDTAPPLSDATEECIECHASETPGLVADWRRSRHARTSVERALAAPAAGRRVSVDKAPAALGAYAVGCAECHTVRAGEHPDTFDHEGHRVHTVVSSADCATCHPVEVEQFGHSLKSEAWANLMENPAYVDLAKHIAGPQRFDGAHLVASPPDDATLADACLACHGTRVRVEGTVEREGMTFPRLVGWPNQGVGRINPDGSKGACTACHARHAFSIEVARKPYTCGQCHKGPDVPAYKVYAASKHGNIYASEHHGWRFDPVPWAIGRDLQAPTCATCHMSALVDADGGRVASRTHQLSDRLPRRLFGLPYAHAHPKAPATAGIRTHDGLPLPTSLDGTPAAGFLIDDAEAARRSGTMRQVCRACHSTQWVDGHFARLEHTVATTNALTLAGTRILREVWRKGHAQGPGEGGSLFDEPVERLWVQLWMFYANSTRLAAAMAAADHGVFAGGRFQLAQAVRRLEAWLDARCATPP